MSTVQEIEVAITRLSPKELEQLHTWMEEQCPPAIDSQLKADLDAGAMDARIEQALADQKTGNTRAL